jgi:limonene-1,2-epoxide hydrolase
MDGTGQLKTTRRGFLGKGAAAAALAVGGLGIDVGAAEMSAEERANVEVVNSFMAAWTARDLAKIMAPLADTIVYRATETAEPIKGKDVVEARLKGIVDRVDRFDVIETWARGPMVVNDRIDRFTSGNLKAWHGVGVFFLKEGKIVEWLDYTVSRERG